MTNVDYLDQLKWRYATKKFDTNKELAEKDLEKLLEAIRLSASSYGLQPYEVYVIKDEETRKKLHPAAFQQPQILDASYLLVFTAITKIDEAYLNDYIDNIVETRNMKKEDLSGMKDIIMNAVISQSDENKTEWAKKQAYIALGNLLSAAAHYQIDVCPMEGFDPSQFDDILGLNQKNRATAVIATVGFRHKDDGLQHADKVRKSKEELFTRI
ncbi:NAD(P)H-dependent oxidoreductase [Psychroflexus planctonicus]|uniref:NAD(P)H-dependent oxidoreductase n=1 Tax=Psychroflexus planctonicus TaxID=1526575 RepID=A0ABQ1SMN1_9FLAO|nr:NAD(P)H-dependent oxidoreductase [Psychroflexus planctonicus]GGE42375.1 NAD(P)H-dependent oxidoreductase [Psychroflexus planctonicus]